MSDTPAPEFQIIEQQGSPMIVFTARDTGQAVLANRAVSEVLADHGLEPRHAVGAEASHGDGPHMHGWSAGPDARPAQLRGLLAEVAERFESESFG
ncbi:MAG: hypothetical protein NVSMB25_14640 [Thermoleophilaceae bacterium]